MKRQDDFSVLIKVLADLPEAIGKSVAKWLIKADLPAHKGDLKVEVYLELGFQPVEIVDLLYPNLGKTDRRTKAQAISLRRKK